MYANTGLDFFGRYGGSQVAFFDVANPQPMLQAIEQSRGIDLVAEWW